MAVFMQGLPILLCFIFGVILLVVEAFIPGFGVAGITGIILQIAAVTLMAIWQGPMAALWLLFVILILIGFSVSMSLRSAAGGRLSKSKMILHETEKTDSIKEDLQVFVNKTGTVLTPLKPAGIAEFDGVRLDVCSEGGFINTGSKVRILSCKDNRMIVRLMNEKET